LQRVRTNHTDIDIIENWTLLAWTSRNYTEGAY
jgi:hypothetical protein